MVQQPLGFKQVSITPVRSGSARNSQGKPRMGPQPSGGKVFLNAELNKKKKRYRPGTVALREIKRL